MLYPSPDGCHSTLSLPLQVAVFQEYLPLISAICNPGLRERHWAQMAEVVGFEIKRDEVTSLKRLIDCDIVGHLSKVRGKGRGDEVRGGVIVKASGNDPAPPHPVCPVLHC